MRDLDVIFSLILFVQNYHSALNLYNIISLFRIKRDQIILPYPLME